MSTYRMLGNTVVGKARFAELSEPEMVAESAPGPDPLASLRPTNPETEPAATQFVPIGLGKPLTVLIRHVYTGKHPKSSFLGIGGGRAMCIVTGLKDYAVFAPSTRAVNFLQPDIGPKTHFKAPNTFAGGTNVVAYSPAVLTDQFHFTIEIAFDRFPDPLVNAISIGLGSLAGIPLMVPAQGYLLAASSILKIGSDWADALVDGRASFSVTESIDFNVPGSVPARADFRVLCQPSFDPSGMRYDPKEGLLTAGGKRYDGDEPYVIISLDGAVRRNLEQFSPTAATASELKQFFAMRDGGEASVDAVLSAFRLANDLKYREEAKDLTTAIAGEADPARKSEMEGRLDALKKNILTTELKL